MSLIKLHDFAIMQGVTDRAIQKHLKKYADEIEPHVQRRGPDGTWLTDEAQNILRSKMKTNPLMVMDENNSAIYEENKKLKDELLMAYQKMNEAKDFNTQLLMELSEQKLLAAKATDAEKRASEAEAALCLADEAREQAEKQAISLRQKNIEIEIELERTKEAAETTEQIAEMHAQEAERAKLEAEEAKKELEKLKNRNFWQRVFNK